MSASADSNGAARAPDEVDMDQRVHIEDLQEQLKHERSLRDKAEGEISELHTAADASYMEMYTAQKQIREKSARMLLSQLIRGKVQQWNYEKSQEELAKFADSRTPLSPAPLKESQLALSGAAEQSSPAAATAASGSDSLADRSPPPMNTIDSTLLDLPEHDEGGHWNDMNEEDIAEAVAEAVAEAEIQTQEAVAEVAASVKEKMEEMAIEKQRLVDDLSNTQARLRLETTVKMDLAGQLDSAHQEWKLTSDNLAKCSEQIKQMEDSAEQSEELQAKKVLDLEEELCSAQQMASAMRLQISELSDAIETEAATTAQKLKANYAAENQAKDNVVRLEARCEELSGELSVASAESGRALAEVDRLMVSFSEAETDANEQVKEAAQASSVMVAEHQRQAREEMERVLQQCDATSAELAQAKQHHDLHVEEVKTGHDAVLEGAEAAWQEELALLQSKLEASVAAAHAAQQSFAVVQDDNEGQVNSLKAELKASHLHGANVSAQLEESNSRNETATAKVEHLDSQLSSLKAELEASRVHSTDVSAQLEESNSRNETATAKVEHLDSQLSSLKAELEASHLNNKQLVTQLEELTSGNGADRVKIAHLEGRIAPLQQRIQDVEDRNFEMKQTLAIQEKEIMKSPSTPKSAHGAFSPGSHMSPSKLASADLVFVQGQLVDALAGDLHVTAGKMRGLFGQVQYAFEAQAVLLSSVKASSHSLDKLRRMQSHMRQATSNGVVASDDSYLSGTIKLLEQKNRSGQLSTDDYNRLCRTLNTLGSNDAQNVPPAALLTTDLRLEDDDVQSSGSSPLRPVRPLSFAPATPPRSAGAGIKRSHSSIPSRSLASGLVSPQSKLNLSSVTSLMARMNDRLSQSRGRSRDPVADVGDPPVSSGAVKFTALAQSLPQSPTLSVSNQVRLRWIVNPMFLKIGAFQMGLVESSFKTWVAYLPHNDAATIPQSPATPIMAPELEAQLAQWGAGSRSESQSSSQRSSRTSLPTSPHLHAADESF